MKKYFILTVIFLSLACGKSSSTVDTEEDSEVSETSFYFTFDDKPYAVFFLNKDWENAAEYAVSLNGYLTEIDSEEEQEAIFEVLTGFSDVYDNTIAPDGGGYSHFWIGANDLSEEGVWVWDGDNNSVSSQFWEGDEDGVVVDGKYNNWGYEPSNGAGGQDATGIVPVDWTNGEAGTWNDVQETNELYFVVEFND